MLKEIKKRKNNSLQITKKLIGLKNLYKNNKIKFINSLYNFQQITEYLYFLLNIDTFKNDDKLIVYEINECYYYMSCNKIANNYCKNCNNHKIQKVRNIKNIDLNTLFKNEILKKICLEQNLYIFKNQLVNIIKILYQELDANYCKYNGLQLNENKNNALFKDLEETINIINKNETRSLNLKLIDLLEKLYNDYKKKKSNFKNIQDFINSLNHNNIINYSYN